MACRPVSGSGRPGALLRPAPLRTGLATFTASGSSKHPGPTGRPKSCGRALADVSALALGVDETEFGLVRRAVLPHGEVALGYRFAGGRQPLFPFLWVLWRTVGVQQEPLTDWTAPVLNKQQMEAGPVHRQGGGPVLPIAP